MILLNPFEIDIYPDFTLKSKDTLCFASSQYYRLVGSNGSGKSSFFRKVLLPHLIGRKVPFLYFDQQFNRQIHCLKAALAVTKKEFSINDFSSATQYLLQSYHDNLHQSGVIVVDENPCLSQIIANINSLDYPMTVLFISHRPEDEIYVNHEAICESISETVSCVRMV